MLVDSPVPVFHSRKRQIGLILSYLILSNVISNIFFYMSMLISFIAIPVERSSVGHAIPLSALACLGIHLLVIRTSSLIGG